MPERIHIRADTDLRGFDALERSLGNIEQRMRGISDLSQNMPAGTFGGAAARGGGPAARGGGGAAAAAGGAAGGLAENAGNMFRQLGSALGLGALLAPVFAVRDAVRFGMQSLEKAQSMGLSPAAMDSFNRQQTAPFGVGARNAFNKEDVLGAASALATEGMLTSAERRGLFSNAENLDTMLRNARVMGLTGGDMAGAVGKLQRTFDLTPDAYDQIGLAFYKGAQMSQLPNRGDFVKFATAYASEFRGLGGRMEQALGLMAALQALSPRSMKGEDAASLAQSLNDVFKRYVYQGGSGLTPAMQALAMRAGARGYLSDDPIGYQANLMQEIMKHLQQFQGMPPDMLRAYISSTLGLGDKVADLVLSIGKDNSPEKIRDMLEKAAKGDLGNMGTAAAERDSEFRDLSSQKWFRTQRAEIEFLNFAFNTAAETVGIFDGTLQGATESLKGFSKWLGFAILAQGGTALLGQAGSKLLGGLFGRVAAGGAANAAANAARPLLNGAFGASSLARGAAEGVVIRSLGARLAALASKAGPIAALITLFAALTDVVWKNVSAIQEKKKAEEELAAMVDRSQKQIREMRAKRGIAGKGSWNPAMGDITGTSNEDTYRSRFGEGDFWAHLWDQTVAVWPKWLGGRGYDDSTSDIVNRMLQEGVGAPAMAAAAAGAGGSRSGSTSVYQDQSTTNIHVNSANEAEQVARGIENEKSRRAKQQISDIRRGVDSPEFYSPYNTNDRGQSQNGSMTADGQMYE